MQLNVVACGPAVAGRRLEPAVLGWVSQIVHKLPCFTSIDTDYTLGRHTTAPSQSQQLMPDETTLMVTGAKLLCEISH